MVGMSDLLVLNAHLDSRLVKISHTRFEFEAMTVQSFFILLGKHPLVSARLAFPMARSYLTPLCSGVPRPLPATLPALLSPAFPLPLSSKQRAIVVLPDKDVDLGWKEPNENIQIFSQMTPQGRTWGAVKTQAISY